MSLWTYILQFVHTLQLAVLCKHTFLIHSPINCKNETTENSSKTWSFEKVMHSDISENALVHTAAGMHFCCHLEETTFDHKNAKFDTREKFCLYRISLQPTVCVMYR